MIPRLEPPKPNSEKKNGIEQQGLERNPRIVARRVQDALVVALNRSTIWFLFFDFLHGPRGESGIFHTLFNNFFFYLDTFV